MKNVVYDFISTLSFVKSEIISLELYKIQAVLWESNLLVRIPSWVYGLLLVFGGGFISIFFGVFGLLAGIINCWPPVVFVSAPLGLLGALAIYEGMFIIPSRIEVHKLSFYLYINRKKILYSYF